MMAAPGDPSLAARLSIRASADGAGGSAPVQRVLRRLGVHWGRGKPPAAGLTAVIDIRDLQGRRVLEVREARPPLDLELPAGTYHVSVVAGDQRRLYTILLEPGARFALCVHAAGREVHAFIGDE